MDKSKMEEMLREYIEVGRRQAEIPNSDQAELRRYYKLTTRLQEELALYEDFHLWLKFTHPDILDSYRCVRDIKEKANERSKTNPPLDTCGASRLQVDKRRRCASNVAQVWVGRTLGAALNAGTAGQRGA